MLALLLAPALAQEAPTCLDFGTAATTIAVSGMPSRESSGLTNGRADPDVYYTLDDGGNDPVLYLFRLDGLYLKTQTLHAATNTDWEDLAAGPCPAAVDAEDCLYVADIGDNDEQRAFVTVWVVPETTENEITAIACDLVYPEGKAHDAESLAVGPDGSVRVFTKEGNGATNVYHLSGLACFGDPQEMTEEAELALDAPATGAAMSADGTALVVRANDRAWLWTGCDVDLTEDPVELDLPGEPFGEAITFSADGLLVTTAEEAEFKVHVWPCDTQEALDCEPCGCGGGEGSVLVPGVLLLGAWRRRRGR